MSLREWMTGRGDKTPSPSQTQQQQKPDGQDDQNNGGNNDDLPANIWAQQQQQQQDNNQQQQNNQNNNQQQNNNNNAKDAATQIREHLEAAGIKADFTPEEIKSLTETNDPKVFSEKLSTLMQKTYIKAMQDSNQLIESKLEKAVETAVAKAVSNVKTDGFKEKLQNSIPLAKDPNITPIAEAIAGQFLKSGKSQEDTIKMVQKFFGKMANASAKDLGLSENASRGRPTGQNGFGQSSREEDTDWLSMLTQDQSNG